MAGSGRNWEGAALDATGEVQWLVQPRLLVPVRSRDHTVCVCDLPALLTRLCHCPSPPSFEAFLAARRSKTRTTVEHRSPTETCQAIGGSAPLYTWKGDYFPKTI
jgi:hypothetical protein